jgi:hypothetical protein
METWTYVIGLIIGSVAVLAVIFVYVKDRTFGTGGTALSLVGVILLGLSIWSDIQISVNKEGVDARFETIERNIEMIANTSADLTKEVDKVANNVQKSNTQFLELTNTLNSRKVISPDQRNQLQSPIRTAVPLDRKVLRSADSTFTTMRRSE